MLLLHSREASRRVCLWEKIQDVKPSDGFRSSSTELKHEDNHISVFVGEGFMYNAGFGSLLDRVTDCRSKHNVFDMWLLINSSSL